MEMVGFRATSSIWELAGGRASLAPHLLCPGLVPVAIVFLNQLCDNSFVLASLCECLRASQLSATDISAQAPMKGAAKCDNHCELQNSVNQWILERALHSRVIPGSMPASVLVESSCKC